MVKQLILGFTAKNSDPIPVYAGKSAAEAEAAKRKFPQCTHFEQFNNISGVVKRNQNHVPPQAETAAEDPIVQDQSEDEASEPATKPTKAKK